MMRAHNQVIKSKSASVLQYDPEEEEKAEQ